MNDERYSTLPVHGRAELVWNEGRFIEAIETNEFDISLYAVGECFVEMYYSVIRSQIEDVKVLTDEQRLRLYFKPDGRKK